ncbi:hypothetical protein PFLUV_G00214500 [Perca fluviatilis]|uniref:Uncharacterized protein n=1 Tax=Perca fluviatilis TaxID=8168 RepID=A0A6A5E7T6_PERFL|nr:hypothetical protein PFLUV_G00214500 [Perca fluviatilis]
MCLGESSVWRTWWAVLKAGHSETVRWFTSWTWTCASCHPPSHNYCMDFNHRRSEAVIHKPIPLKFLTVVDC